MNKHLTLLIYLKVLLCIGCGQENTIPTSVSGLVKELGSEGLADVHVCLADSNDLCTHTDTDGMYSLQGPPAESDLSFTVTKDGYLGGAISVTTGLEPVEIPVVSMAGEVILDLQMGILNVDALENTGQIAFSISNGINGDGINIPNIQTILEPASGSGPFYSNASGLPDLELTQTSANGGGVYVNVEPGIYTLQHLNISDNCTPMLGWGPAASPSFQVFENRVTYVRIECLVQE